MREAKQTRGAQAAPPPGAQIRRSLGAVALAVGLAAVGCATTSGPPITRAQLGAAESSVKAARDSGAAQEPRAARFLKAAEDQLVLGKQRAVARDNRTAALLLARAEVDGELAHLLRLQEEAGRKAQLTEQHLEETRSASARPAAATPAATPGAAPAPAATPPAAPPLPDLPSSGPPPASPATGVR